MNRISIPSAEQTPAATLPLLDAVKKQLGVVPNLMKVLGNSPAALEAYLNLNSALAKGSLGTKTAERIALAVAEINACNYCLSAHTYLGKNVAKLEDEEMVSNRKGASIDVKANAAVRFAAKIVTERGHIDDQALQAVKTAGFNNAEIVEIVLHVALNTLTNYINSVAETEIDFPLVKAL